MDLSDAAEGSSFAERGVKEGKAGNTETMERFDLAIVGGGIAGYSAALTAKNLLLNYLWLGESGFGDKLRLAEKITNFPALSGDGARFAAALGRQREEEGIILTEARADGIYSVSGGYLITAGERSFEADTVILATGVETRATLNGERDFLGKGVSYCAVCDGALYRGKRVAAVLSSAKFEDDARYLARFAREVICFCLYPNPSLGGERLIVRTDVPLAVLGGERVRSVLTKDGEVEIDGVFLLKNSAPPAALCGGLETEGAHVKCDRLLRTNLPGLFAAGDVTGRPYQYVKAAGEGCVAAHMAREYLRELRKK